MRVFGPEVLAWLDGLCDIVCRAKGARVRRRAGHGGRATSCKRYEPCIVQWTRSQLCKESVSCDQVFSRCLACLCVCIIVCQRSELVKARKEVAERAAEQVMLRFQSEISSTIKDRQITTYMNSHSGCGPYTERRGVAEEQVRQRMRELEKETRKSLLEQHPDLREQCVTSTLVKATKLRSSLEDAVFSF